MQVCTIDALLAGGFDGHVECRELLRHGDFGLGTFDRLDGEMVVLDGIVYQIKADGSVTRPDLGLKTPFAAVCRFETTKTLEPDGGIDLKTFEGFLEACIPDRNVFCAIRLDGTFAEMTTRSVPAQDPPYPLLVDVAKKQSVFRFENIRGTIVGFRCPSFVQGINVPGYHLHFISDDRTRGGHILNFRLATGTCRIGLCHRFLLQLPESNRAFQDLDLSKDRSAELQTIER
jgi:acetolactate decarboxylase